MKARSREPCCLIKRAPNSVGQGRQIQDLRGAGGSRDSRAVQDLGGLWGGLGFRFFFGQKHEETRKSQDVRGGAGGSRASRGVWGASRGGPGRSRGFGQKNG